MCELLGMSANVPTDICFSFAGLTPRGGETGIHQDGFGITFYEGKGSRSFHDPRPSSDSQIAEFLKEYPIKSNIVIAHIRKANRGKICLENTHPFTRELWGTNWNFAHNGQLKGIKKRELTHKIPIGTTDSEHAFCWMLERVKAKFKTRPKSDHKLIEFIKELSIDLSKLGVFNMLLSDSNFLYVFCSTKLHWIVRRAPFGKASLIDADWEVNLKKETTSKDVVAIVATMPLTHNESWSKMNRNEFKVFQKGTIKRGTSIC